MIASIRPFVLGSVLAALMLSAAPSHALFGGVLTDSPCNPRKAGCIYKAKNCLLNCHRKAVLKGVAVDPDCLARCRKRFIADPPNGKGCFEQAEAKNGCNPTGEAASFAARIDAHVEDLLTQLVPGGVLGVNKCAGGKLGCVAKYNKCILQAVAEAAAHGTAIGDISKCTRLLDGTDKSCFRKLEAKYCSTPMFATQPSNCPAPTRCLSYDDEFEIRRLDDAYVDSVIAHLETGSTAHQSERCTGDTSVACASAPGGVVGCGGPLGTCEFFFGSYVPQSAGGVAVCVRNQWNGVITGTFDRTSGAGTLTASLRRTIYNGVSTDTPCPRCFNDEFPNDGASVGSCLGGTRNGLACDANGVTADPLPGWTSLDCPPSSGVLSSATIALAGSNDGAITATLSAASPTCSGAPGDKCLCASCSLDSTVACMSDADCTAASAGTCTNNAGEPRKPNACLEDCATAADGTLCAATPDGEGVCPEFQDFLSVDRCRIASFRSCFNDSDCSFFTPGDTCRFRLRECFPGYNGDVGDGIGALGSHAAPRNGHTVQTFATIFCVPPTAAPAVNAVAGLPGPGRLQLGGVGFENGDQATCPTTASFLPTSRSGVLDMGWTGIAHDQRVVSDAKVTVAVTGCSMGPPACGVCSYSGPVAN